jgi:hypothetical protein
MLTVFGGDKNMINEIKFSGKAYVNGTLTTVSNLDIKGLTYNGTQIWGKKMGADTLIDNGTVTVFRTASAYNHENINVNISYADIRYGDTIQVTFQTSGDYYLSSYGVICDGNVINTTKVNDSYAYSDVFTVTGNVSIVNVADYPHWRTIWTGSATLYLERDAVTYTKDFGSLYHTVSSDMPLRITSYGTKGDSKGNEVTISKQDIADAGSTGVAYQIGNIFSTYRFRGLSNSGTNAVTVTIYSSTSNGCTVHFTRLQAYY